ncbi:MAG: argininosuccinate lyase [Trueperaceae bacterium]|nr:MAG: argininosuccinate lyase [Trueperaceae bacterium]
MTGVARWHEIYRENVLMPDYRFASQHLAPHFLDAMTAHVRTVKRLPDAKVRSHQPEIARLEAALAALRHEPLPRYDTEVPDLYFAFNARLEGGLGREVVSFLRMGLSRNDLDMTVYKMRTRELLLDIIERVCALRRALLNQASTHVETVFIAQTHHQPGQPTTVAHYLAAVDNVLARDLERLLEAYARLNTCPLGAAALAGSSHPLDRHYTAELLGFDAPVSNTYDAVAASDWQVEFATNMQSVALTLSRFVCDLLIWTSQGLYVLAEGLVQGSSIMPQKRNPVVLEHARTRFSRALGSSQMMLYSSHNIPFADLNDFGPDIQGALISLFIQLRGGLELVTVSLEEGAFDLAKLAELVRCTDTTATELADELTRRCEVSFQEAHRLAGELVKRLCEQGRNLQEATSSDLVTLGGPELEDEVLKEALDAATFVRRRYGFGGPAPEAVGEHVAQAVQRLGTITDSLEQKRETLQRVRENLSAPEKERE